MVASAIFILDAKGKVLINRFYRGDVTARAVEQFMTLLLENEEDGLKPIIIHEGITYVFVKHNVLALTRRNSNAATIMVFLHKLIKVFEEYFKEVVEESVRDNFVIIYELLDEMMDFGYPQITESKILQEYITQESYKLEVQVRPPMAVTNAVSWRSEGIRYRKNEVFLDVIESVNLLIGTNGSILRSEILGSIKMRVNLSGMPELRLGLNDKVLFDNTGRTAGRGQKSVELEDVKFHQCVRLSKFESDRTISFIPPDGDFELLSYRLSTQVKPLFWVDCSVQNFKNSRLEYSVKVKSQFKSKSIANNVQILVPAPEDAACPKFKTWTGHVRYAPELNCFVWTIRQFPGMKEYSMTAHFNFPSVRSQENEQKMPVQVKFEIPYYTVSGIQVRYLKILEKSGYQALPWVRYITQNGDYHIRIPETVHSSVYD